MVYMRQNCDNCNKWFEYVKYPIHKHEHEFCCEACLREYHFFRRDMSATQFFILSKLVDNEGEYKFKDCRSLITLSKRIVPLIEIIGRIDETTVYVAITERGRWWYKQKTQVK